MLRKAFTIPEMLAVVAIIVIILAMLLPQYGRARQVAMITDCSSNHRNMMLAFRSYTVDHRGFLPFNNWLSQDPNWRDMGGAGWLYKYPSSYPNPFTEDHRREGAIWPYVRADEGLYRCPMDEPPWDTGPTHAITSYLISGAVSGFGKKLPVYKSTRFDSDAMLMWEVDEHAPPNYYNDGSSFPDERITNRHGDGLTISFVDGHTEWVKWIDYQKELLDAPGRLWCNPGTANGKW